ncbi:MAG: hypothetical protein ACTSR2_02770 [Candidatus Hodarchaeales archaeon]
MVRLKAVYLITDTGLTIYNQSFGATEQDQDMVGSLIMALTSFGKEALGGALSDVGFGKDASMILEEGKKGVIAIAIVVLDKEHKEKEEFTIRNQLYKFVQKFEEKFSEELKDPIFQKSSFSGVGTMVSSEFFRDKMSKIYGQDFASLHEYLKFPATLLFEMTPRGERIYSFYRDFPKFNKLLGDIPKERFDALVDNMIEKGSMVSLHDCLEWFGQEKAAQILDIMKYLTAKGMFDAYNFERIITSES